MPFSTKCAFKANPHFPANQKPLFLSPSFFFFSSFLDKNIYIFRLKTFRCYSRVVRANLANLSNGSVPSLAERVNSTLSPPLAKGKEICNQ